LEDEKEERGVREERRKRDKRTLQDEHSQKLINRIVPFVLLSALSLNLGATVPQLCHLNSALRLSNLLFSAPS
jgi:hypothetical protein